MAGDNEFLDEIEGIDDDEELGGSESDSPATARVSSVAKLLRGGAEIAFITVAFKNGKILKVTP